MRDARTVRGVNGFGFLKFGMEQSAHDVAKTIAAVAHRQQPEGIAGPRPAPTSRDGFRRGMRAQRAFEFIGDNEDIHGRLFIIGERAGRNVKAGLLNPCVMAM